MKAACSRADLVRALLCDDPHLLEATAEIVGFALAKPQLQPAPASPKPPTPDEALQRIVEQIDLGQSLPLADVPLWQQVEYEALEQPEPATTPPPIEPVQWTPERTEPLKLPLLAPWRELQPRLRRVATAHQTGTAVDLEAVVDCLSRGRLLHRLPRERRRHWGPLLHIILDRCDRLAPFWTDQDFVVARLARLLPPHALERAVVWEGLEEPRLLVEGTVSRAWQPPPPGSLVLVLGDLGCYAPGDRATRRLWLDLGRTLTESGCRTLALLACPVDRCQGELARFWSLVPWERPRGGEALTARQLRQRAERLLGLVSPGVRLEPGLLREVRLLLSADEADVGTEGDAWNHPGVVSHNAQAATLDGQEVGAWRESFARESPELRRRVLAVLRRWRIDLPPEIWFEEILCLDPDSQGLLEDPQEVTLARRFFLNLVRQVRGEVPGGVVTGFMPWYHRFEARRTRHALQGEVGEAFRELSWQLHKADPDYRPEPGFDPQSARSRQRRLVVVQRGRELVFVEQPDPMARIEGGGSPLAVLDSTSDFVRAGNESVRVDVADQALCPLPRGEFSIASDRERLTFRTLIKPQWADAVGRDRFGLWAEFAVEVSGAKPVVQRMRWIAPGRFLMGSPKGEEGRWEDEGPLHWVTLTEGYWLFDTPCTQALWEAVIGENPSEFKSPNRPVESVSWDDAQKFIASINSRMPGLELVLPSEAQWEYACRAGTRTATYAGNLKIEGERNAPILHPIAWYGGNSGKDFDLEEGHDASDWEDKQFEFRQAGTRIVAQKLPNPWGLYDMLGNVYEWCRDDMRDYATGAEVNPLGPMEAGGDRVIRGGAWRDFARSLRAAFRLRFAPGLRHDGLGFRCARVQS